MEAAPGHHVSEEAGICFGGHTAVVFLSTLLFRGLLSETAPVALSHKTLQPQSLNPQSPNPKTRNPKP